jgi:hypothetical protein
MSSIFTATRMRIMWIGGVAPCANQPLAMGLMKEAHGHK